jgi:hypothetical protein
VQSAAAETLIQDFERGSFDERLAVGGKVSDTFLQSPGNGDQDDVIMPDDQPRDRSPSTLSRSLRTPFGEYQMNASVYRSHPDLKSRSCPSF